MNNQLTIDLRQDCVEQFRRALADLGYSVVGKEGNTLLYLYHKLTRRIITSRPREVKTSLQFTRPEKYTEGLRNLKRAIAKGDDLSPFMSKTIKKVSWHDRMLDYWRIHHFHLGGEIGIDGFVKRTRHVLMAFVDASCVYFISVEDHSAGKDPWYKKKLLTVVHDNWPELIAYARLPEGADVHHDHCDEDIKQLRHAGLSIVHKIGDTVYVGPGGLGVLGDGTHIDDRRFADRVLSAVENVETEVVRDWASIRDEAAKQGIFLDANATLSLRDIFLLERQEIGVPIRSNLLYLNIIEPKTGYWFRRYAPPR